MCDRIQDIDLPCKNWKAPGNMMRSPGLSIIHKADNPQGLTTLLLYYSTWSFHKIWHVTCCRSHVIYDMKRCTASCIFHFYFWQLEQIHNILCFVLPTSSRYADNWNSRDAFYSRGINPSIHLRGSVLTQSRWSYFSCKQLNLPKQIATKTSLYGP